MAHDVHIAPARHFALVKLFGRVDHSDLFDALRALREKGWEPSFNVLCDAAGIQELVLRPGELEKIVTMLNEPADEQSRDGRTHGMVAVVVQRPLDYSAASLYKELAARHGFRAEVCWSRKRAYEHLGLGSAAEAIEQELQ